MSDVRSDDRHLLAALEQLAARLPHEPPAELEERLMKEFRARTRTARRVRWLRVAAAVLLPIALAAGWFLSDRLGFERSRRSDEVAGTANPSSGASIGAALAVATSETFLSVDDGAPEFGVVVRVRLAASDDSGADLPVRADVWLGDDGRPSAIRVLDEDEGSE